MLISEAIECLRKLQAFYGDKRIYLGNFNNDNTHDENSREFEENDIRLNYGSGFIVIDSMENEELIDAKEEIDRLKYDDRDGYVFIEDHDNEVNGYKEDIKKLKDKIAIMEKVVISKKVLNKHKKYDKLKIQHKDLLSLFNHYVTEHVKLKYIIKLNKYSIINL